MAAVAILEVENSIGGSRCLGQRAASWAVLQQGEALRRRGHRVVVCFLRSSTEEAWK